MNKHRQEYYTLRDRIWGFVLLMFCLGFGLADWWPLAARVCRLVCWATVAGLVLTIPGLWPWTRER
jgi:hypothetical protein